MAKMRELPRMAHRRKGWKDLTHILANETERVWSMSRELTSLGRSPKEEKESGIHGVYIASQIKHRVLRDASALHLSLHRNVFHHGKGLACDELKNFSFEFSKPGNESCAGGMAVL
jgi:hypothetical protein